MNEKTISMLSCTIRPSIVEKMEISHLIIFYVCHVSNQNFAE